VGREGLPTVIDPVGGGWVASLARPDGPQVLPRTVSVLRGAEIAIGCYLLRCMGGHPLMARLVRARPGQGVGADRNDDRTRILGNHYSRPRLWDFLLASPTQFSRQLLIFICL